MPEPVMDFGSWRSLQAGPDGAGGPRGKKRFEEAQGDAQKEIEAWMSCLGVGCRTASVVSKECIEDIRSGECKDYRTHKTTVTISHGPYLDDWSKVPAEIASQYNTSPTYKPK